MNSSLEKHSVLVLNKSWQAINVTSPSQAFSMMFSDSATGLDVQGEDNMVPLKWNEWIKLEAPEDESIKTVRGLIKIPKIIILSNYNSVPKKRPRFTTRNIWERDGGICQYTGRKLTPNEGNIDHVIPKSRGGKTSWSNCVLSHKDVNTQKGDRTPSEAGLTLLKQPKEPNSMPTSVFIRNRYNIREWNPFLYQD